MHIHEQVAGYIGQLVRGFGEPVRLGVVQTAYANGSSTRYITDVLVSDSLAAVGLFVMVALCNRADHYIFAL